MKTTLSALIITGLSVTLFAQSELIWRNPLPVANLLTFSTYANGLWIITSQNGTILTSPDGRTWSKKS